MNVQLGKGQEISIEDTGKSVNSYYKTLYITTEDNQDIEINLFSKDKKILL